MSYDVTRAHLKNACDANDWDLLDKLLELSNKHINDTSLYTDTWGEWWGLLFECVRRHQTDGVRVLLKHGADRELGNWGDCIPETPLEYAQAHKQADIIALLTAETPPTYTRQTDPPLPKGLSKQDRSVNRQGRVSQQTGLVFQAEVFDED